MGAVSVGCVQRTHLSRLSEDDWGVSCVNEPLLTPTLQIESNTIRSSRHKARFARITR